MKKYIKLIIVLVICFVALFGLDYSYVRAEGETPPPTGGGDTIKLPPKPAGIPDVKVDSIVQTTIRIIFVVGQVAFVLVLLMSGVMFITSAGNEQNTEKAKKAMTFAIIGIIVLFSAWGLASFIVQQLK